MSNLSQLQSILFKPKSILVALLILILLTLALLQIFKRYTANQPQKTPPPSTIPSPISAENLQNLISKMPYESQTFRISYDNYSKTFRLIPKNADSKQVRENLASWLNTNGLDISQIKIIWSPLPGSLPKSRPIN